MVNNHALGSPLGTQRTKILMLGSGELGREIVIELMRLGAWVCAADSYEGAPAAQVAHESRVLDMANPDRLDALIDEIQPDIIIPEVEAIATQELQKAADRGIQVTPSSQIAAICMDRERLRVLAHESLGLPTTPYRFAGSLDELLAGAQAVGFPCVIKPIMSSSGHGQSVARSADDLEASWDEAQRGRRSADDGEISRVIVEAFAPLQSELTVLTVSSSSGTVTCEAIGQRQEDGDYRESWQPVDLDSSVLEKARALAVQIVDGLVDVAHGNGERGWGVFGVELFVLTDGSLLFNEVSPRPHDTGMVTMISQRLSEFALHARAVLGIPVTQSDTRLSIPQSSTAASRAIVVEGDGEATFTGVERALSEQGTELRLFGKPSVHGHRRMGVALSTASSIQDARNKTQTIVDALTIRVH
ncbi:MAG: formate-dependent phosphoribosylglycinamide formyltransferase [Bifidobacterium sp.]|uniref:Formate-dependent phosphoribosylglycinamide formyltransferase n=2 Tax=Bifidobacterium fermentum TaxID=3059035 RepID=A0AB39UF62_9BIFI